MINLLSGKGDALAQALAPAVEKMLAPMWTETRNALLLRVAGPVPELFAERLRSRYGFTDEEVTFFWGAAIDAAATVSP
jgi:hypothetical protein